MPNPVFVFSLHKVASLAVLMVYVCVKFLYMWSRTEPSVFRTLAVFVLELAVPANSSG